MLIQEKSKDIITHDFIGFKILNPSQESSCFIKWSSIDTIIFSPNNHYEDAAQWIIYLNEAPKWSLNSNAWWLGRITFFFIDKKYKKIRIRDDFNKDFYDLPNLVEKYLNKKEEINYQSEDDRKTELSSRKATIIGAEIITEEFWKPKRSKSGLPWKMLYDRYNRTVDEIYKRDGSI